MKLELSIHQYPLGPELRARCALCPFGLGASIVRSENRCSWRAPFGPRSFDKEYFIGIVTHVLTPCCRPAVMPVVAMVRGEKTQLRRICYEMKKEGFNLRYRSAGAQSWVSSRPHLRLPERRGGKGVRRVRTTCSRQRIRAEEQGATWRLVFVFSHIPSGGVRNVGCVRSTLSPRVQAP
jgi:hypothetical protein